MTTRITKKIIAGVTQEQFEAALALYARSHKREAEIKEWMENEIRKIAEKYMDELAYLQHKKTDTVEVIKTYCQEQKETLFVKKRSYATCHGTVGFRLCTPKLKPMKGHTWQTVLEQVKTQLPEYIRTTEEVAKDQLLAARNTDKVAPMLQQIGVRVAQDETFFIEVK